MICRIRGFADFRRSGFVPLDKFPVPHSCHVVKAQVRFRAFQDRLLGSFHSEQCASLALAACRQPRPAPDRVGV